MKVLNLVLLIGILFGPHLDQRIIKPLIGKWTDDRLTIRINKDYSCTWDAGPQTQFEGTYETISDNIIRFSFTNDINFDVSFTRWGKRLIIWNYKTVEDSLGYHLDEISVLYKSKVRRIDTLIDPEISTKEVFRLPNKYNGMVYVCYNQNGLSNNRLNNNTRIITIPEDGHAKTELLEEPVTFGLQNYEFTRNGKGIPFFNSRDIFEKSKREIEKMGYSQDSVYVCLYGFNQSSRRYVNEELNEDIHGNVLMFSVDTLHNILSRQHRFFPLNE